MTQQIITALADLMLCSGRLELLQVNMGEGVTADIIARGKQILQLLPAHMRPITNHAGINVESRMHPMHSRSVHDVPLERLCPRSQGVVALVLESFRAGANPTQTNIFSGSAFLSRFYLFVEYIYCAYLL